MIPLPLAGVALAGSALLAKYATTRGSCKPSDAIRHNAMPMQIQLPSALKALTEANPLEAVIGGLTSAVSQITKSIAGEDYNKAVADFLPPNAVLLKPRHLSNKGELGFADLDGDSQDELLASYRSEAGVGTIVLKKENSQWYKLAELLVPGHNSLSFRDTSALSGPTRQQLLLGFPSGEKNMELHAYSLENGVFSKLFEQTCSRFEILGGMRGGSSRSGQEQLALWSTDESCISRVDVVSWNGLSLEPSKSRESYYKRKVIPYHAHAVRSNPKSPSGWYAFAGVLADAGYTEDALNAVNVGMDLDKDGTYQSRFLELKSSLS